MSCSWSWADWMIAPCSSKSCKLPVRSSLASHAEIHPLPHNVVHIAACYQIALTRELGVCNGRHMLREFFLIHYQERLILILYWILTLSWLVAFVCWFRAWFPGQIEKGVGSTHSCAVYRRNGCRHWFQRFLIILLCWRSGPSTDQRYAIRHLLSCLHYLML